MPHEPKVIDPLVEAVAAAIYDGTTRNLVAERDDLVAFDPGDATDQLTADDYRFLARKIIERVREGATP